MVCLKLINAEDVRTKEECAEQLEPNIDLGYVAFQGFALQLPARTTLDWP